MDNLTHSLVGLMLARAGLNRGEKNTTAMLVVAANIPDVDAYNFFVSPAKYLDVHRGYPHALVFAPLMAALAIALVKGGERVAARFRAKGYTWPALMAKLNLTNVAAKKGIKPKVEYRPFTAESYLYLWGCCLVAVLSHLLLDWTNVYGIRMLLPFSDKWLRLDITNVIDPVIWVILALALAGPAVIKMVNSEVGSRQTTGPRTGWAWFALIAVAGYNFARYNSHEEVIAQLEARQYRGTTADQVWAFPDSFGTLKWRGLVRNENTYYEIPVLYNGYYNFNIGDAGREYAAGESPALDAAGMTPEFQAMQRFDQVPLWKLSPIGNDAMRVELIDMRFGTFRSPGLAASAIVKPNGRVSDSQVGFRP